VELGLSQKELADRMGITQPAISQFESFNANPRIMTLLAYAHALDASLDFSAGLASK
jgi:transcriptional regulator with XRE-family HTH domain